MTVRELINKLIEADNIDNEVLIEINAKQIKELPEDYDYCTIEIEHCCNTVKNSVLVMKRNSAK